ncbi:hypothetical protein [Salinicola tamaricis]|uniref:hypothetical protein n=1 Tax=Salinicola tamaricis TaxID=1771309 RepID=UPI001F5D6F12|nr:hypothetical protein [Salinicola tamaricis]
MKRFTLTVGSQSLQFTEQDIAALNEALNEAITEPDAKRQHRSAHDGQRDWCP